MADVDLEDIKMARDFLDCDNTEEALKILNAILKENGEE
ncbi:Uncharacterised protein [uncultured archaeon]|nr:Uncharacterised protein [uncultured archaeon]